MLKMNLSILIILISRKLLKRYENNNEYDTFKGYYKRKRNHTQKSRVSSSYLNRNNINDLGSSNSRKSNNRFTPDSVKSNQSVSKGKNSSSSDKSLSPFKKK